MHGWGGGRGCVVEEQRGPPLPKQPRIVSRRLREGPFLGRCHSNRIAPQQEGGNWAPATVTGGDAATRTV